MNELSEIDGLLLTRLKQKIEELSGLSREEDLNQKDFDFLLFYIQQKTGQSLSLTTIKRIWRNEYSRLPHLSTLNMLSHLAEAKDWHTLKKEWLEAQQPAQNNEQELTDNEVIHPAEDTLVSASAERPQRNRNKTKRMAFTIVAALLMLFLGTCLYYVSPTHSGDMKAVQFSALPTADGRIPNSVVFSYNVAAIQADHFYIQQSWDPAKRVEISPNNTTQTDIYYEPGYHYAKLLADNHIIKEIPVHIQYKDWYVRFRYPSSKLVKVREADLHTQGHLGLKREYVTSRFRPMNDSFQLGYMLSKNFKLAADELEIGALVRFDSLYMPVCPMLHLLIKGDRDYAWITVGNKGCESNLGLKVGNRSVNGKTSDLSLLGMDAFSWQKIEVKLTGGTFGLSINDQLVQEGTYSNTLGKLKEIDFFFNGIGSIDEINLEDAQHHSILKECF